TSTGWDDELRGGENEYLTRTASRLATEGGIAVETALLDDPVASAIARHVAKVEASLLVITTHGRTGLSRAWLGSTADWLARFASVPVLLVHPTKYEETHRPPRSFRHILIPLDGSPRAERVLPDAIRLGHLQAARYTLIRVVAPIVRAVSPYASMGIPMAPDEAGTRRQLEDAKRYLADVAAQLRRKHGTLYIETEAIAGEHVADIVLTRARTLSADVVAMSTRGRGASRLLLGSVADKILRGFEGAMLLLGPVAARELEDEQQGTRELTAAARA
ncbi:MAG TPA: universal stress protein, partial [Gemmatimonadaceae bacterium]|nr:universal stress protein [Gemmatimonadaceae bacterium]